MSGKACSPCLQKYNKIACDAYESLFYIVPPINNVKNRLFLSLLN